VVDAVDAYGCEPDWGCDSVPEDLRRYVARVGVDKHAGDDSVAVEGLSVGKVCP